ncbi:receptor-interacting serine/threonine-protein kinase 2 isoform X2 [Clupea harengus]|uniref:Receptor-interacting serine/threonine-protein kinase 2 isoform X2 n=1 Tax=Clupea harengus TaxID=7950 RepID=A0A6P8FQ79_CLUHA|nr:receptor-interacting serine/threonine-protein kinase 2 isoform X2 [Clupea harengus]
MSHLGQLPQIEEGEILNLTKVSSSAGACLRGRYCRTGRLVAVKLLPNPSTSQRGDWVKQEKNTSQSHHVYSERVLVPLGVYRTRFLSGLVWEWMAEGALHSLLYETKMYPEFPVCLRLRILSDIAEGLSHLHSIHLPHLALRATHVLLDQHYRAKLCDWGLSELYPCETVRPCYRNLAYLSPEALQGTGSSLKTDIYSLGVLIWETLNRRLASEDFVQLQIMLHGTEQSLEEGSESNLLPLDTPNVHALTELVMSCWNGDPQRRPSAEDCILELRKALLAFDPVAPVKAALHLKEFKRALMNCKNSPAWEIPIELNNLEISGDYKYMHSKTLPMDIPRPHPQTPTSAGSSPSKSSPLPSPPRTGHHIRSCFGGMNQASPCSESPSSPCVLGNHRVQLTGRAWPASPPPHSPSPPSKSPSPPSSSSIPMQPTHPQSRSRSRNHQGLPGSSTPRRVSCRRLLLERRELIIRGMTEGRLNHLLDVLRSRQALNYEAYEIITAAVTLAARTRSLLDTCCCLGEKVAALVAVTLGLVSATTTTKGNTQLAH